ncbi:MAG: hypothetical protein LBI67_00645 [Treponema sp.]|nr:hypothetical protein [Treponema sp.]
MNVTLGPLTFPSYAPPDFTLTGTLSGDTLTLAGENAEARYGRGYTRHTEALFPSGDYVAPTEYHGTWKKEKQDGNFITLTIEAAQLTISGYKEWWDGTFPLEVYEFSDYCFFSWSEEGEEERGWVIKLQGGKLVTSSGDMFSDFNGAWDKQ